MGRIIRTSEIHLEYQNYIERPPCETRQLLQASVSNDTVTMDSWRQQWIDQMRLTKKRFGSFKDHGLGQLFGKYAMKPCILAGSGPSLKHNVEELKKKKEIPLISCLHNFHFMEDHGIEVDYYVTLDAGEVTVEEVSEGGEKSSEEYWELTKNKTLLAFVGTHPKLFEKWQGKIYLFNCPVPDKNYQKAVEEEEPFYTFVSTGGNVLGACLYIAKAIFGCNPVAYIGADFSFSNEKKFHSWNSKYDKSVGNVLRTFDIFGNKAITWPSYHNFKSWFEWVSLMVPGIYLNCTEGGILGAYAEGNLMSIPQLPLSEFILMYTQHEMLRPQCENPGVPTNIVAF